MPPVPGRPFNVPRAIRHWIITPATSYDASGIQAVGWHMQLRILVVEDDEPLRVLAQSVAEDEGYRVKTAGSVVEAKALMETEEVDLLLTDINLHEEMTGGILVAEHARSKFPGIPVIYTSGAGVNDGTRALFVEDSHFLPKPYKNVDLLAALRAAKPKQSRRKG